LEEFDDFSAAMAAPEPPEPQTRTAKVAADEFMEEIFLPVGTDIRPTALSLVPYEREVKELVRIAKELEVTDAESQAEATKTGLRAKKLRLRVEKIEDSPAIQAALTFVKDARALIKTLTGPLKTDVEMVLKAKLTAYSESLRLAQQRREAEAREKARKLQAELDAEAQKLREEAEAKARAAEEELAKKEAAGEISESEKSILQQTVEEEREAAASIVTPTVVVEIHAPENVVRTGEGASFTTSRWKARLVDINLVDRKYLVENMKAVQRDVDAGVRKIDGFVIEEVLGTSFRG
jgi:hypothetical protein